MKLTDNQRKAVHFKNGNALINAASGSGKTHVITARIANLIANEKVSPESILALTFTKEAAENMRSRLKGVVGKNKAERIEISTFHSFAYRYMREYFPEHYKNTNMMQGWWKMSKLYDIVSKPSKNNDIGLSLGIRAGELGSFISYQKANMVKGGMEILLDKNTEYVDSVDVANLQHAFDLYCQSVSHARLVDFDDMLVDFYYKLKEDEVFRETIKDRFRYILVDEFQDTNTINLEIVKLISENNLFAVGDFRQGIYGFINANIDNILDFSDMFEDVEVIELNDNFRSTERIVDFINDIIAKSPNEKYKQFGGQSSARGVKGDEITLKVYNSEINEIKGVIDKINEVTENGDITDYNDFAIITRTNAHIGMIESMFAEEGIPVDVSNTRSFFDRKEIADLLSYAKHAVDKTDDMSIRRVVNSPSRFISKSVIANIEQNAYKKDITFEESCKDFSGWGIDNLVSTFKHLRNHTDVGASKFLREVYRHTRYEEHLNKTTNSFNEFQTKQDAINRLFELSNKFSNIEKFLSHVSIIQSNNAKGKDGVKLMTAHAAKGLEYEYVFVVSATEDNFPHSMSQDPEEERRLFYVACSRAKEHLEISLPIYSSSSKEPYTASPFLVDVVGNNVIQLRKECMNNGLPEAEAKFAV